LVGYYDLNQPPKYIFSFDEIPEIIKESIVKDCIESVPKLIEEVVRVSKETGRPVAETLKQVSEPLGSIDIDNAYQKAMSAINSAMDRKPETQEEKAEYRNKIKQAFGKEPKVGGRRY
jgi:hypothetical protein